MSKLLKELKESQEYKDILAKMSDEERKLSEQAIENLLKEFEETVLDPLKSLTPR